MNGLAETLVTWKDSCGDEGVPSRETTHAAIGATKTGFTDTGTISPPNRLSYPAGAFLDDAGNAWVVGFDELVARRGKYDEIEKENTGVWLAFRPAGASFQLSKALPTGGSPVLTAFVAGNRAGVAILTWTTSRGTFVAWGTPTGTISPPQFLGHGFQVARVGVDDRGRALIVGYYPRTAILTVTGRAGDPLSRVRTLAAAARHPRKHLVEYLGEPLAAIGPSGNAFIAWETNWVKGNEEQEFPAPTLLVNRRASGQFNKPVHLAKAFFGVLPEEAIAAVDSAGGAIILRAGDFRSEAVALAPSGHIRFERLLPRSTEVSDPSLAGNEHGQVVVGWPGPCGSCISTVLATTRGALTYSPTFVTRRDVSQGDVTMTISDDGTATAFWVEGTGSEGYAISARVIAPGTQTVVIAQNSSA